MKIKVKEVIIFGKPNPCLRIRCDNDRIYYMEADQIVRLLNKAEAFDLDGRRTRIYLEVREEEKEMKQ